MKYFAREQIDNKLLWKLDLTIIWYAGKLYIRNYAKLLYKSTMDMFVSGMIDMTVKTLHLNQTTPLRYLFSGTRTHTHSRTYMQTKNLYWYITNILTSALICYSLSTPMLLLLYFFLCLSIYARICLDKKCFYVQWKLLVLLWIWQL